ncbi:MAG: SCO family protein [Gammaproteobacteria bacterium]|nr:SCO family protein [Gammaproteobacteria bacterium]
MTKRISGQVPVAMAVFLFLLVALAISVYLKWQRSNIDLATAVDQSVLRIVPQPIPVPDAKLIQMNGQPFGKKDLLGKWTFLYFGYTLCPDVCPTELSVLAEVADVLRNKGVQARWQQVFISVDPERDTPEQLGKFVGYFDPKIIAATGDENELRIMAQPIGVGWKKAALPTVDGQPSSSYLIDHTTSILLINPDGAMIGVFPTPHNPEAMVKAFLTVIHE